MKLGLLLGLLLFTSCGIKFEKGKCYSHTPDDRFYKYGQLYINDYLIQYDKFDKLPRVYGNPSQVGDWERLTVYGEIACPKKFGKTYEWDIIKYKRYGIYNEIQETLKEINNEK